MVVVVSTILSCSKWMVHPWLIDISKPNNFAKDFVESSIECYQGKIRYLSQSWDGRFVIRFPLVLSTLMPFFKMTSPSTMPFCTIKWFFFPTDVKGFSWQRMRTSSKWSRHSWNKSPNTKKSSMKISKNPSTISKKYSPYTFRMWYAYCRTQWACVYLQRSERTC